MRARQESGLGLGSCRIVFEYLAGGMLGMGLIVQVLKAMEVFVLNSSE